MVHPEYRREGIARLLMTAVESEHPAVRKFELVTGAESRGNIALYRGLGYVSVGTQTESSQVTLVRMVKERGGPR